MKQTLTLFTAILLLAVGAAAQKLSYQAVVRNNANELVTETTVQVVVGVARCEPAHGHHPARHQDHHHRHLVNSVPYALYADNVDPAAVSDAIVDYIANHNFGGEDNVQADWNVTDQSSDAFIRNKPDLIGGDYNDLANKPAINYGLLYNWNAAVDTSTRPTG